MIKSIARAAAKTRAAKKKAEREKYFSNPVDPSTGKVARDVPFHVPNSRDKYDAAEDDAEYTAVDHLYKP